MAQKITPEQVQKIARLARLRLNADDEKNAVAYLGDVLNYMDTLADVDVEGAVSYRLPAVGLAALRADDYEFFSERTALTTGEQFTADTLLETKAIFTTKHGRPSETDTH